MKVFLTGGTGFIGQQLTRALLSRGWHVVALVRKPDSPQGQALSNMGAELITGDITDRESMRAGMTGADIVIHNAGWYEIGIPASARKRMYEINVGGTGNTLGLALELGIPRTVYVSSSTYYGYTGTKEEDETYRRQFPYKMYYEQTKAEAHELAMLLRDQGLPLITVCPAHVMGPNDSSPYGYFIRMYVNGIMPPFAWSPGTVHSPVHVEEAAEAIALAAKKGRLGETYLVAGESISFRQLFQVWAKKPGGFRVRFFLPNWLALLLFSMATPILRSLGLPGFISREVVSGSIHSHCFTATKARRELGWSHRSTEQLWSDIIDEEHRLLAARKKRDLISRLNPVEELSIS